MTCLLIRDILGSYLDGELDANAEIEVSRHLPNCEVCTAALNRLRAQQLMIRHGGLSHRAPASLESRIRNSLSPSPNAAVSRQLSWQRWLAIAATILVISVLSTRSLREQSATKNQIADQVISSHVRAMLTGHTADVVSTDRHTVKPWFNGRLDFSPPVINPAERGFPLTGGRTDYVDHRLVAALAYQRRKHIIDLFIWPSKQAEVDLKRSSNGYNVLLWSSGGMAFAAVSDLNAIELEQFKNLLLK